MTRWTFVGKVISLLYNMLSKLVITFPPGSKNKATEKKKKSKKAKWLTEKALQIAEEKKKNEKQGKTSM